MTTEVVWEPSIKSYEHFKTFYDKSVLFYEKGRFFKKKNPTKVVEIIASRRLKNPTRYAFEIRGL